MSDFAHALCFAVIGVAGLAFGAWLVISSQRRLQLARRLLLAEVRLGEGHGLVLAERVFRRCGVKLGQDVLYPALRDLEWSGQVWARDEPGPPERGGRPSLVYCLTAAPARSARSARPTKPTPAKGPPLRPARGLITQLRQAPYLPFAASGREEAESVPRLQRRASRRGR